MLCHVVRAAQELQHSKVVIVGSPHSGAAVQQVMTATEFCSQKDLLHLFLQHAIWSQHYCKGFIRVMVQVLEGAFPSLGHDIVLQEKPTGFRDAVMAGLQSLPDSTADLLVIPGNLPLLTSQTLLEVVQQGQRTATDKHRGLTQLCTSDSNEPSGIFWAAAAFLREKLRDLPNGMPCLRLRPLLSKQLTCTLHATDSCTLGWHFCTAIEPLTILWPGMSDSLDAEGLVDGQCERCSASDPSATLAVHTRQELVEAESVLRRRHIREHQAQGVTFRDPDNTFISAGVDIGRDSVIGVGVQLYGNTSIGRLRALLTRSMSNAETKMTLVAAISVCHSEIIQYEEQLCNGQLPLAHCLSEQLISMDSSHSLLKSAVHFHHFTQVCKDRWAHSDHQQHRGQRQQDRRILASGAGNHGREQRGRPLCQAPSGRCCGVLRLCGQLLRGEGSARGRWHERLPSLLPGRCGSGRECEYWCRHHHMQLQ